MREWSTQSGPGHIEEQNRSSAIASKIPNNKFELIFFFEYLELAVFRQVPVSPPGKDVAVYGCLNFEL